MQEYKNESVLLRNCCSAIFWALGHYEQYPACVL